MGSGYIGPHFLDLGTSWRCVVSFTPLPLYPRARLLGTHWIGGWLGPRFGLDNMEKRKSWPYRDSNSNLSVVQPVDSRYTAIPSALEIPYFILTYKWKQNTHIFRQYLSLHYCGQCLSTRGHLTIHLFFMYVLWWTYRILSLEHFALKSINYATIRHFLVIMAVTWADKNLNVVPKYKRIHRPLQLNRNNYIKKLSEFITQYF
jgi:hypothetical protein